jgi:murein DD-endopeptidase MepM/ murein hydrolase activator NlpD
MTLGQRGWDVAALQFLLRRRGYSSVSVDGGYGPGTASGVRRYQAAVGLPAVGYAGPATQRALVHGPRRPSRRAGSGASGPVRFFRPVHASMGDGFGMRWGRMHTGIDFPAPTGTRVGAAGRGTVSFAGWNSGGYGNLVVVQHRLGFQSWYAHMSSIAVRSGQAVTGGSRIGYVGSTGHSTGPHMHFEVRLNGTPINPIPYLLGSSLARAAGRSAAHAHSLECTTKQHGPKAPAGSGRYATAPLAACN